MLTEDDSHEVAADMPGAHSHSLHRDPPTRCFQKSPIEDIDALIDEAYRFAQDRL